MNKALRLTAWVVVIHLLVTLAHGAAHTELAIELSFWMNIYVYVVILAGPLVALGLIWRGIGRPGYALLFLTMAGSFLFGAYHHFVLESPDHVAHVPAGAWGTTFAGSAVALAIIEAAGCAVAIWRWEKLPGASPTETT